ncbi:hypothetical protein RJ55_07092 [Drechmeria coniospora]|nr:hypothetical protein RJ55_07092 [Drechmeria coniospora]
MVEMNPCHVDGRSGLDPLVLLHPCPSSSFDDDYAIDSALLPTRCIDGSDDKDGDGGSFAVNHHAIFTDDNFRQLMATDWSMTAHMTYPQLNPPRHTARHPPQYPPRHSPRHPQQSPLQVDRGSKGHEFTDEDFAQFLHLPQEDISLTISPLPEPVPISPWTERTRCMEEAPRMEKAPPMEEEYRMEKTNDKTTTHSTTKRPTAEEPVTSTASTAIVPEKKPKQGRLKAKQATFILTGQTVERNYNGVSTTSYYCSDGVIRILSEENLRKAQERSAAMQGDAGSGPVPDLVAATMSITSAPAVASEPVSFTRKRKVGAAIGNTAVAKKSKITHAVQAAATENATSPLRDTVDERILFLAAILREEQAREQLEEPGTRR